MRMRGSVTIFLSLSLSSFLLLISVLASVCVINGEKQCFEIASDVSLGAIFGEYEKNLYREFGLLYIDASYLGLDPEIRNVEQHLRGYMKRNTDDRYGNPHSPWGYLHTDTVKIDEYRTAAYEGGGSMRSQAVREAESSGASGIYGSEVAQALLNAEGVLQAEGSDPMGEWSSIMEFIAGKEKPKVEDEDGRLREIEVNNPADGIYGLGGSDILYSARLDPGSVSGALVDLSLLLSQRGNVDPGGGDRMSGTAGESSHKESFLSYLTDHFGCYRNEKDRMLKLETEYMIAGENSDYANFRNVAERIFMIRFADNLRLALGDGGLQSEAFGVAEALEICAYDASFIDPVALSILYACAFLETLSDMEILYGGGRIPVIKSSHSMHVSDVLAGNRYIRGGGEGLTYRQFLICFLSLMSDELLNFRVMDLMELEIRRQSGNPRFLMDRCVERVRVSLKAKGGGPGIYELDRTYGYY